MPELPDVEVFKQYLDATSLHQVIESVEVTDRRIMGNVSAKKLQQALKGRRFQKSRRYGKYLFIHISEGCWLVIHFGMTGFLKYFKSRGEMPSHSRLLIKFTHGYFLAFHCQRLLGEINLVEDPGSFIEKRGLGPDALDPEFDFVAFKKTLSGRKGMVKSTLMNQHIISGIGNIYADEILFQAKVHPTLKVDQLSNGRLENIFQAMKKVLQVAVKSGVRPEQFPTNYLLPHRGTDDRCPKCGGQLKRVQVSGRGTYYCPECQKL